MSGTLIVSLDFELFWGMLDQCPLEEYRENVLGGRAAIPRLLELFERHGIHATWATVGFMFAENYEELKQYLPAETLRPTYQNKALSPYGYFETIGKNEEEDAAKHLIELSENIDNQRMKSPSFLMILTAGQYAYRRADGVYVVPIGCLKD